MEMINREKNKDIIIVKNYHSIKLMTLLISRNNIYHNSYHRCHFYKVVKVVIITSRIILESNRLIQ